MTSNQVRGIPADTNEEQVVAQYLQHNVDFFERHPQLLARMRLQHPRNASTVSLIERQVEVLRDKYEAQEQKLAEFVRVARANNLLAEKIHRFTRRLLTTRSRGQAINQIEASLREDFDTFHAVLVLAASPEPLLPDAERFVRSVSADDPNYRSFESLFVSAKPRCGQIRDSQREFLFNAEAINIGSVALIPLGGNPAAGLLALGSVDRDRFHPGMSIEFLARMGELITDALAQP
ncbi:MAG TPA: DUF484 family protein [Steroidobacteraceae bacterium]